MPAPRFDHGFANDVFISYTHVDNALDTAGRHWVSEFTQDLKTRLAQVSGRSIEVWRDNKLGAADRFDQEIKDQLARSAVLATVLTPSYFASSPSTQEREEFVRCARTGRGLDIGNKRRIVKVAKTHVDGARYPEDLRELLEHQFYVEEPNGTRREFHLHEREEVKLLYATRMDDVAWEIAGILAALETEGALTAGKGVVYVAETSPDLDEARLRIVRALRQRGYDVVPGRPLRLLGPGDLRAYVGSELARCRLSVHPVGALRGEVVEEEGTSKAIVQIQIEIAAEQAGNGSVGRLIWVPGGLKPQDQEQKAFLELIRARYAGRGFELIERPIDALETHVRDRLGTAPSAPTRPQASEGVSLYLVCDRCDHEAARPVRQFLLSAKGVEVHWPPNSGQPSEVRKLHQERLREDDAFLIYYGKTDELWVERQLNDLHKALGLGRNREILTRRLYLANPRTPDKEDRLAQPSLALDGFHPRQPAETLQAFLAGLVQAGLSRRLEPGLGGPTS